jgi:hypothetical protein
MPGERQNYRKDFSKAKKEKASSGIRAVPYRKYM